VSRSPSEPVHADPLRAPSPLYDDSFRRRHVSEGTRVKTIRVALLSMVTLVLTAAPAAAATQYKQEHKWFYWIAPLLALLGVLSLLALAVGYCVKVVIPKYRGR
jgi:hypothetical protein